MNIKGQLIKKCNKPMTFTQNIICIYGLPYSIICLIMALNHIASTGNILGSLILYAYFGMISINQLKTDARLHDNNMIKFDYYCALFMSFMATIFSFFIFASNINF